MERIKVVYALKHEATGKLYIGSTENYHTRKLQHLNRLKHGQHSAKELQADFDRYANKNITFSVLDQINSHQERLKEYEWMKKLKTYDRRYGYNYADPKWPRKH